MPRHREGPVLNKQTGYYFFDQYVGVGDQAKRLRISLHTRNPARAQFLWEQEYRRQWAKFYGLETPSRPEPLPFATAVEEFIEYEKGVRKVKEWRQFESRLKIASRAWGPIDLSQIDQAKLLALDRYLKKEGRSEYTRNHYFGVLKNLFNWAIRAKKFAGLNPVKEIKPYVVDSKRRAYSPEELGRILAAAERVEREAWPHSLIQRHAQAIVLILLFTGMRIGELLNLTWHNIRGDKIVLKADGDEAAERKGHSPNAVPPGYPRQPPRPRALRYSPEG
jgi:integrase